MQVRARALRGGTVLYAEHHAVLDAVIAHLADAADELANQLATKRTADGQPIKYDEERALAFIDELEHAKCTLRQVLRLPYMADEMQAEEREAARRSHQN